MSLAKQLMSFLRMGSAELEDKSCKGCKAIPATVTPHKLHVLIRLPSISDGPKSWPERVDDDPALSTITTAIKNHAAELPPSNSIKVTAFDYCPEYKKTLSSPLSTKTYEAFIFPVGVHLTNIQDVDTLASVVLQVLIHAAAHPTVEDMHLQGNVSHRILKDNEMALIICCHKARDYRCGRIGPQLASKLANLGAFTILSSHVGGHAYAGNVICYCKKHPADGHWFGGLTHRVADQFWKALYEIRQDGTEKEPCMNAFLNNHWRGKVGLSKEEQKAVFDRCCAKMGIHDIEDM